MQLLTLFEVSFGTPLALLTYSSWPKRTLLVIQYSIVDTVNRILQRSLFSCAMNE